MNPATNQPKTMLGAVFHPGNTDLVLDKKHPVRQPGKGEVLLKVAAAGVCHTDVFWLSGAIGSIDPNTYIMGHEISGTPVELGEDVDPKTAQIGKLYSVLSVAPCVTTGILGQDGGYAEFVTVRASQLVEVPAGVSKEEAAIASDAGVTAFNAVKVAAGLGQGGQGKKVLIFGIGGLGHLAVQYAKHFGATVYACDIKPDARKLALELGAVEAFDLLTLDKKIKEENFTVDITIDFPVTSQTFAFASSALADKTGKLDINRKPIAVVVGLSEETLTFSSLNALLTNVQIHNSLYGSRDDLVEVLDLFAKRTIKGVVTAVPLEKVNEVLDDLRAYEIHGRRVVIPSHHHD
ncbi:hypothetical protein QCA50_015040 [Cerrena zonata]|uniref:Enoyl reductase (ER) domain-containing protein n=1 Tax=Cerrena zonata TaxID=2478898 RepID=A0AAW0FVT9_9APHY